MRRLFISLNAIDKYHWPASPLAGCGNDAIRWSDYLNTFRDEFEVIEKRCFDEDATKHNILDSLKTSLESAGADDVVFFFYSGHGARENSQEVFHEIDGNGKFETLVPIDGIKYVNDKFVYRLISDKELHYTLSKYSHPQSHVITVFDSCHSGNVTRNMSTALNGIRKRSFMPPHEWRSRLGITAPSREWNEFIFSSECTSEDLTAQNWYARFPKPAHVAMSACLSDESAYEVNGEGIFTKNMIEVLKRSSSAVSYRTLHSRLKGFVRNQMNQTPELFAPHEHRDILMRHFLDRSGVQSGMLATCSYHREQGWCINMGRAQGVRTVSGPIVIGTHETVTAGIKRLHKNYTEIVLPENHGLSQERVYDARVVNYLSGSTSFFVQDPEVFRELSDLLEKRAFALTEYQDEAQYCVVATAEGWNIRSNDSTNYLVWHSAHPEGSSDELIQAMSQISSYHFIKDYENPDVEYYDLPDVTVEAQLRRASGDFVTLDLSKNRIDIDYREGMALKLRIVNASDTKYFCSLLYLNNRYGITDRLIDGGVKLLEAGASEWILQGAAIPLQLESHIRTHNIPYSLSYLKLIVNRDPFSSDQFEMEDLQWNGNGAAKRGATRGGDVAAGKKVLDWFTQIIEIKINNPWFSNEDLE